jgi:hypothetical protein
MGLADDSQQYGERAALMLEPMAASYDWPKLAFAHACLSSIRNFFAIHRLQWHAQILPCSTT